MGPEAAGEPTLPSLTGPGAILRLIRNGEAVTRADLQRQTGLARSTVAQRVDALLAHGLVEEVTGAASTGGRPPTTLALNRNAGLLLAADLGATHSRLAVSDLGGEPLAEVALDMDIADGPEAVLGTVHKNFLALIKKSKRTVADVRGIGIGVPGPVSFSTGMPINPPIMPGWDGFSVPGWFSERYPVRVLVDNDVNIMALGEHWAYWRGTENLLFVKVGTGIGCGIVAGHTIHRGAQGGAGDIGHIRVSGHDDVICRCGNTGCLEAVAGGRALARRLREAGAEAESSRDVVDLVRAGDTRAVRMVREAGRSLGEVLAACVNFFNPSVIVIGGDLGHVHEQLLAGIREVTFQRSLPLATQHLETVPARLGDRAGIMGAAILASEHALAPSVIDRELQEGIAA
jgi:predicted NBD/HSP70 family sugar kinase